MIRRPPRSTRTDTLFPYTTLFRSPVVEAVQPGLQRRRGLVAEIGVVIIGARFFEGVQHALSLARAHVADMGIVVLIAFHIGVAPGEIGRAACRERVCQYV